MNETKLTMAYSSYRSYTQLMKIKDGDERQVNHAAYFLQQSMELALKHCIELTGQQVFKTHDISVLLKKLKGTNIFSPIVLDKLELAADTITGLESKTRYIENYLIGIHQVETISKLVWAALAEMKAWDLKIRQPNPPKVKPLKLE